jgi:hypothetical protein
MQPATNSRAEAGGSGTCLERVIIGLINCQRIGWTFRRFEIASSLTIMLILPGAEDG